MARVVLENIYKSFAQQHSQSIPTPDAEESAPVSHPTSSSHPTTVLKNINLTVNDGEFMVLVGASGCGKSTLLRLLAGLESVTAGTIWVGDRRVNHLPPKQRNIAMVFQNYALYPHMTVYDNLAFGLRRTLHNASPDPSQDTQLDHLTMPSTARWHTRAANLLAALTRPLPKSLRYWSAQERWIDQRVRTVATMLQVDGLLNRLPKQLSGGQKQRVALGRAMARNPQVFLMDEPLSNLDAKLRAETRTQIVSLQRQLGITTIYVTHDQVEAMTMGDRIAVIHAGQIQQIAPPLELYHHPANQYVAGFIGSPPMNFIPVHVATPTRLDHPLCSITLSDEWSTRLLPYQDQTVILGIRPEHIRVSPQHDSTLVAPSQGSYPGALFHGQVEQIEALGNETYLSVAMPADRPDNRLSLQVRIHSDLMISRGNPIGLTLDSKRLHLFDSLTGQRL